MERKIKLSIILGGTNTQIEETAPEGKAIREQLESDLKEVFNGAVTVTLDEEYDE